MLRCDGQKLVSVQLASDFGHGHLAACVVGATDCRSHFGPGCDNRTAPLCTVWLAYLCRSNFFERVKTQLQGQVDELKELQCSFHLNYVVSMGQPATEADIELRQG